MSDTYEGQPITAEVANEAALYAMLASNCYHNDDREVFKVEDLGWHLMEKKKHFWGLAYDVYQQRSTGHVIWAFRGTDSALDYATANLAFLPFSPFNQYRKANKVFKKFAKKNGLEGVTVCGHSLGGGLALSMSVRHGVPAFAFDSSPRIFDGIGDKHRAARRVIVYEDGEILQKIRERYPKIKEAVPEHCLFKCSYNFAGSQHRGDKLARALLEDGARVNPGLRSLL